MRCLEKQPEDRWQTTEELVPLLESLGTPSGGMTPSQTRPVKAVSRAPAPAPAPRRKSFMIAGAIAVLLLAGALGAWGLMRGRATGGTLGAVSRVAVMPLRDISGSDAVFAESLQDALITGIAGMDLAGVVPRS